MRSEHALSNLSLLLTKIYLKYIKIKLKHRLQRILFYIFCNFSNKMRERERDTTLRLRKDKEKPEF